MRYETDADRVEEARIGAIIAKHWRCEVRKMPERYTLDYAAVRGDVLFAALEIKARNRRLFEFQDVFVNLNKVVAARGFEAVGVKTFYIVQFTDHLAYTSLIVSDRIEYRGRKDRQDWEDVQPVVCIGASEFKVINPAKEGDPDT